MIKKMFVFSVLCMLTVAAYGSEPVLFFSDLTDGSVSGWEGSAVKGAAVSVWGNGFGSGRDGSYVTCGDIDLVANGDYAEWGVVNTPAAGEDPNDVYSSARGLERITFWLNSNMAIGDGTITVTTGEGTSNAIPFHCRANGNIYFISRTGHDSSNGLSVANAWFSVKKVRDLLAGDIAYFRSGVWNEVDGADAVLEFKTGNHGNGTANKSITIASYPGEFAQLGDSTVDFAFRHWGTDNLDYWTFSKFILRSSLSLLKGSQGGAYSTREFYTRWIGNDASTTSGSGGTATIFSFTGGALGQDYLYFYGNHVHDAGVDRRGDRSGSAYGVYFAGYGHHDHIYFAWNEVSYQSDGRGIQLYGHHVTDWMDNVYIHDNYLHHNAYQGAVLGGGDGVDYYQFIRSLYFYNNILAYNGNTDWIELDTCGTNRGCFNNLLVGGGVRGGEGGYYYVFNNVIYQADNHEVRWQGTPDLVEFKNNVIWAAPGKKYHVDVGDRWQVIDASNNCYLGGTDGIPSWDQNSVNQDPEFAAPANYFSPEFADFSLLNTSPCIDAGTSDVFDIVGEDYSGMARPQGVDYDIGAYEYLSGGVPNKPPVITSLIANPTAGQAPLTVNFTVTAEDVDGTIVSYTWDFGDGGISNDQHPTHVYSTADTYTAIVEVKDDKGAKTADVVGVTVTETVTLVTVIIRLADGRQAKFKNLTETEGLAMVEQVIQEEDYKAVAIKRQ